MFKPQKYLTVPFLALVIVSFQNCGQGFRAARVDGMTTSESVLPDQPVSQTPPPRSSPSPLSTPSPTPTASPHPASTASPIPDSSPTPLPAQPVTSNVQTTDFYHGGPVMLGPIRIYYIWYGDWSYDSAVQPLLTHLVKSYTGSRYFNTVSSYYDLSGTHVSNSVNYMGAFIDNYSHGKALTDQAIQSVVTNAITTGGMPADESAVYIVLTSQEVTETGPTGRAFCTPPNAFTGYHNHFGYNGKNLKYAFVGDPRSQGCSSRILKQTSPNNDPGADAMANTITHELAEAITNPLVGLQPGWVSAGKEIGDLCESSAGVAKSLVMLGGTNYYLQPIMLNNGGAPGVCSFTY